MAEEEPNAIAKLTGEELLSYQALIAKVTNNVLDRACLQLGVKELMRKMTAPLGENMPKLKRVARYLVGAPRIAHKFVLKQVLRRAPLC